jgi:hypothetical protein
MRWRKTAAIGGAALGAAALYNTTATRELMDDDVLGGEPDEFRWRGHRIALTRHGEGKPVLLLHGLTAAPLARRYAGWFAAHPRRESLGVESGDVSVGRWRT